MTLPEPPRQPGYGFLYFPPYRVQGYSVAGEETFVQIPELDLCFDVGNAPKLMLNSNFVALSHGHMDHSAGLGYYFSQRVFQGMKPGTLLCHAALADPIRRLMSAWVDVEAQRTPYQVIGMQPGTKTGEFELKKHVYLRAFETHHTVPSLGFVVVDKRSKLREEYTGLPQEKLIQLKKAGQEITYIKEVPIVAYLGDTATGSFFSRPDVSQAEILISECTFLESDHRDRAKSGKHLHVHDIVDALKIIQAKHVVLTHLSRRTHMGQIRQEIDRTIPAEHRPRVHLLMDHRANRARYETQLAAAEQQAA